MSQAIDCRTALHGLLAEIYGEAPDELLAQLSRMLDEAARDTQQARELWSQQDVVLITYADQIREDGKTPLTALTDFLIDEDLTDLLSCVHLLPFCPYSSDDGFSVIDYLQVDPDSGTWDNINRLGEQTDLMFDLVLNHCSQFSEWFKKFLAGDPEFADYFVTADPQADHSQVTRPRSLPLLTEFPASEGSRHVWTTFSADQVDLNYKNPRVLKKMIDIIIEYARRGARIIRLDAIAYLWKQNATPCIHLPQTHAVVRLMRLMLDQLVPGTLVLTETNVPHDENVSYFGSGDEAHMVYQFSLPPLLLDAMQTGDTRLLKNWLSDLKPPYENTTFFNFTASHDGIGVRPLEGIASSDQINRLASQMKDRGGRVNTRRNADGSDSPYELNITYVDAIADRSQLSPDEHARRFLASQMVMLSLQGMPAVYFHSLVGSPNDQEGVEQSGQNRRINRHKYERQELRNALADEGSSQRMIFDGYKRLLGERRKQLAFHPDANQKLVDLDCDGVLCFQRGSDLDESIVVVANLSNAAISIPCDTLPFAPQSDVLGSFDPSSSTMPVAPYQVRWLRK